MVKTLRHLFTPHHTNNHRPRVLHPMGMVVMIALVLGVHSSVSLIEALKPQGLVLGFASNISASQVFEQTNAQRVSYGLSPLTLSSKLSDAAAAKAADMFAHDYWAHISPSGIPPWTFIKNTGYRYSVAGENLARDFDSTGPMVDAWMASPTHKANIVHTRYSETGIAVVNGTLGGVETTLVVQMFGLPVQPVLANNEPVPPTPQPQITEEAEAIVVEEAPAPETVGQQQPTVLSQSETSSPEVNPTFVSPLDIKKSAVLAVVLLIMAVLIIDEAIIRHRQTVRFVGRNLAHFSFLGLTLIIIWSVIQPGVIQ